MPDDSKARTVLTIGYPTRILEELISLLKQNRIERLVDIRHFPRSRHNPQFEESILQEALLREGTESRGLEQLGGYREQGYGTFMETAEFRSGLDELETLAGNNRTACMCAELKWWQCLFRP